MTTPSHNLEEVTDYESQARDFLASSRDFLAMGNLHQASEKAWGAAAHMAKAVAVAQGWEYESHSDFSEVMYKARLLANNPRISELRSIANELHHNFYRRKRHLSGDAIREDLERIEELVDVLHPLTGLSR